MRPFDVSMRVGLIAVACSLSLLCLHAVAADTRAALSGRLTKVIDGDTIQVQIASGPIRVRLYGIDAPEKKQAHGDEAAQALAHITDGKELLIEPMGQDTYDRMLGIIHVNELNVNSELVKRGHAWAFRRYMKKADAKLCEFEATARTSKAGLWSDPADEIEAPWEWRNKKLKYVTDFSQETAGDCIRSIGRRKQ